MKILIVSGFLGAGKTTFIQSLVKHTDKEFAVFENELAGQGIDGNRLKSDDKNGKVNVWEMTERCICCEGQGDFRSTILVIANSIDPDYLIVEPTGVGMLANIISNLQSIAYEKISLIAPITIVDGLQYEKEKKQYPAIFENQVANAQTILISKTEQMDDAERSKIVSSLRELNHSADILSTPYEENEHDWWEQLLRKQPDGTYEEVKEETDLPDTFSLRGAAFESPERLFIFLEDLTREWYGNIIRAKGNVKAGDYYFRFDVVGNSYVVTGDNGDSDSTAVFIGFHLDRMMIRKIVMQMSDQVNVETDNDSCECEHHHHGHYYHHHDHDHEHGHHHHDHEHHHDCEDPSCKCHHD